MPLQLRSSTAVEVFYAYAHEDEPLRNEIDKHLSLLKRHELISVWYDRDIRARTEREREIDTHLNTARIILLLISPDFIASDYWYGIEMERAVERHKAGEARVIPIILRPADWEFLTAERLLAGLGITVQTDPLPDIGGNGESLRLVT